MLPRVQTGISVSPTLTGRAELSTPPPPPLSHDICINISASDVVCHQEAVRVMGEPTTKLMLPLTGINRKYTAGLADRLLLTAS